MMHFETSKLEDIFYEPARNIQGNVFNCSMVGVNEPICSVISVVVRNQQKSISMVTKLLRTYFRWLIFIRSGSGSMPIRRQAITWTNADVLSIWRPGMTCREIIVKIQKTAKENTFQDFVCKIRTILFMHQCINLHHPKMYKWEFWNYINIKPWIWLLIHGLTPKAGYRNSGLNEAMNKKLHLTWIIYNYLSMPDLS